MNKEKGPLVSVVMATFNEPKKFIEESISSILEQTHQNLELLIADDSTNEETIKVIDDFAAKDDRVVVIRKNERMGFVNALNECLNIAKGDFIARMDGDDISLPNRFEIQLKYAEKNPDVIAFGGDVNIVDENGEYRSRRHFPLTQAGIKLMFLFRSPFAHPVFMFRRTLIDKGIFYDSYFKKAEDIDFYLRILNTGSKMGNVGIVLANCRVFGNRKGKRPHDQWIYNHRARSKNFNKGMLLFSVFSWTISCIYILVPTTVVEWVYKLFKQ